MRPWENSALARWEQSIPEKLDELMTIVHIHSGNVNVDSLSVWNTVVHLNHICSYDQDGPEFQ